MGEINKMSMTRRALSNICTGLCTFGVYLLLKNVWVTLIALVVFAYIFAVLFTKTGFAKRFKILLIAILLIALAIMCFFRFRPVDKGNIGDNNNPVITDVQENKDDENDPTDDQEVITEEDKPSSNTGKNNKKNWSHATLPDKVQPSYSNATGLVRPDGTPTGGEQSQSKVEGPKTDVVVGESQTSNKETQAANDAAAKGDKTEQLNEGVIAGTKPVTPEPEADKPAKDESKREDPSKNKVEEVTNTKPTPPPAKEDEIPLEEQLKEDLTDKELEDLVNSTPKEEPKEEKPATPEDGGQTTKPEQNDTSDQESSKPVVTPDNNNDTEDGKTDDNGNTQEQPEQPNDNNNTPIEPENKEEEKNESNVEVQEPQVEDIPTVDEKPTVVQTPVTITPLDGNVAYAGDSVQFKVTGEVGEVNGLDGLKYSLTNGYLTVETNPGEATVLSVQVVGADGVSNATSTVTINVINVQ